jgi:hypothetical protein
MDPVPEEYFQDRSSVLLRGAPSVNVAKVKSSFLGMCSSAADACRPRARMLSRICIMNSLRTIVALKI